MFQCRLLMRASASSLAFRWLHYRYTSRASTRQHRETSRILTDLHDDMEVLARRGKEMFRQLVERV